jgi:hypothetical protein
MFRVTKKTSRFVEKEAIVLRDKAKGVVELCFDDELWVLVDFGRS